MALSSKSSVFLYSLEQQLIKKYNDTLHQEYFFWQLKSRILWLNYSDANTKFFHLKTLQHRSQSCIVTLKDEIGIWLSGEELTLHIRDAFKTMFTSTSSPHRSRSFLGQHHCQNSHFLVHQQWLTSIPQLEEIARNMFSLPHLMAPGQDGYHAVFFQKSWHIIGPSVI